MEYIYIYMYFVKIRSYRQRSLCVSTINLNYALLCWKGKEKSGNYMEESQEQPWE